MDISTKLGLPMVANTRLHSEIDFYGLSSVLAKQLQIEKAPRSSATWRHGWVFVPLQYVPQLIWMHHDAPFHLVATEKEAAFLADKGIRNVVAAGLPFIYADLDDVDRISKSLLVMPPHTLEYAVHGMDESGYIEYIKSLSHSFSRVVFCLHQSCIGNGGWCRPLEKAGIDWIIGASAHDSNSLFRMQKIFRSFEYMTTCTVGSHLVYGAYCGCKVSISGGFFEYKRGVFKSDPYYLKYPEILSHNLAHSCEAAVKSQYPFLFVDPHDATTLIDWAHEETGASCRKSAEELKKYLGWDFSGQVKLWLHLLKKAPKNLTDMPGILSRRFARRKAR